MTKSQQKYKTNSILDDCQENFTNEWNRQWTNKFRNRDLKNNVINYKNTFRFLNLDKIQFNDLTVETYTFIFNELQHLVNLYFFENNKQSTIVVITDDGKTLFKVIFGRELTLIDLDRFYVNFKIELEKNDTIKPLFFVVSKNDDNNITSETDYLRVINVLTQQKDTFSLIKHRFFAEDELVNIEDTIDQIVDGEAVAFNAVFQNTLKPDHCDCNFKDVRVIDAPIDNNLYSLVAFPYHVDDNIYLWKIIVDQIIKLEPDDNCQCDNGIKIIKKNVYSSEIILFSHSNPELMNNLPSNIIHKLINNIPGNDCDTWTPIDTYSGDSLQLGAAMKAAPRKRTPPGKQTTAVKASIPAVNGKKKVKK